jgi:DNA-binding GntR family transcriptional regulator
MPLAELPTLGDRQTASDHVADALRQAIIGGQFDDGEELNQVELAQHFNVSRVPIREALRRLQAEGLVSAAAHRRATVIGLNRERAGEIFAIRALLETFMLERAAEHLTTQDLDELNALCDVMDKSPDHAEWLELNHRFHHQLLSPSGSPVAMAIVERLAGQVERYLRRSGGVRRVEEAGREHRQILRTLKRGDVDRAKEILSRHILSTWKRVSDSIPPAPAAGADGAR